MTARLDPGLGQRGPEGVPQCVWGASADTGDAAVVAEDRAQPGRGQSLPAGGALGDEEQGRAHALASLGQPDHGPGGEQQVP